MNNLSIPCMGSLSCCLCFNDSTFLTILLAKFGKRRPLIIIVCEPSGMYAVTRKAVLPGGLDADGDNLFPAGHRYAVIDDFCFMYLYDPR